MVLYPCLDKNYVEGFNRTGHGISEKLLAELLGGKKFQTANWLKVMF